MEKVNAFLKRKNIVFSAKRYGIDALGAMAQGLFCSLLIGTILNTLGTQFHIGFLTAQIGEKVPYTVGGLTSFMSGPAMAIAIGYALQAPPLVLFSLAADRQLACQRRGTDRLSRLPQQLQNRFSAFLRVHTIPLSNLS